jgi:hypothetical protein
VYTIQPVQAALLHTLLARLMQATGRTTQHTLLTPAGGTANARADWGLAAAVYPCGCECLCTYANVTPMLQLCMPAVPRTSATTHVQQHHTPWMADHYHYHHHHHHHHHWYGIQNLPPCTVMAPTRASGLLMQQWCCQAYTSYTYLTCRCHACGTLRWQGVDTTPHHTHNPHPRLPTGRTTAAHVPLHTSS